MSTFGIDEGSQRCQCSVTLRDIDMAKNIDITLRLPPELHARAKVCAGNSFMSLNGYILAAVAQVVAEDEYVPDPEESKRIWKAVEGALMSKEVVEKVMEGNAFLRDPSSKALLPQPEQTRGPNE